MPTVLITGATRGFGFELAAQYAADGWRVLACCRAPAHASALKALAADAPGAVTLHQVDMTDLVRIEGLALELQGQAVDVLINNAGVIGKRNFDQGLLEDQAFGRSDFGEWELVLKTNLLGPMKMAEAFIEHVAASEQKKIITLTSIVGSIAENNFGGMYAYRASKAAANAIMKSMAIDLKPRGIIALPLHPGFAKTDLGGQNADIEPSIGAAGMRKVIAEATLEQSGHFLAYDGRELPW